MNYQTFKKELENLGKNTIYSASQILDLTLNLFQDFLDSNTTLPNSFKKEILLLLSSYKPEMSIFINFRTFLLQEIRPWTIGSLQHQIINFKKLIDGEASDSINKLIIEFKKYNIRNVITISYSKLVLNAILKYIENNNLESILVSSSPPKYEGVQFAKDFSKFSKTVNVFLVEDTLLASQVRAFKTKTAVLVGCDSIFKDGSILNKSGTLMLAILSKHFEIPFFAVGSKSKIRNINFQQEIIKSQKLTELLWYDKELEEKSIKVINRYFDYIPRELITKIFY